MNKNISESSLPEALNEYRNKLKTIALVFLVAVIVILLVSREALVLCFLTVPGYFYYQQMMVERKWNLGSITEVVAVCNKVRMGAVRDRCIVTFHTTEEDPTYYQFYFSARSKADDFIVDSVYVLYYDVENPKNLLAYTPI